MPENDLLHPSGAIFAEIVPVAVKSGLETKNSIVVDVNPRILTALEESEDKRVMLEENIEDALGYEAPTKDKPFKAHLKTKA